MRTFDMMLEIILSPLKKFFMFAGRIPAWAFLLAATLILGWYSWGMVATFLSYLQ